MKRIKKVLALVTTLAMLLTMVAATGLTAFAADPPKGSITITNPQTDPNANTTTYEAYRIFDMTTNGESDDDGNYTAVAYTINSAWTAFFAATPGSTYLIDTDATGKLNQITVNGAKKYINITEDNVAQFAKDAFAFAQKNNIATTATKTATKGSTAPVKFDNLDLGYYMIYPKGASVNLEDYTSIVSINSTTPDGEVAQKAKWPGLEKEADDISVEVGQKVTYTLKSKVPDTTGYSKYEMSFADTTTAGLTFDGVDTIVVKIGSATLTKDTDYTVSTATADFSVTINMLKNNGTETAPDWAAKYTYDDPIIVTYTATVNDKAVKKIDENHATLTYHNDPKDDTKKETTPPVIVKTFSSKLVIDKVDGKTKTKLKGAKFVLRVKELGTATGDSHESDIAVGKYYKSDDTTKAVSWVKPASEKLEDLANDATITVVETDENGAASFDGLENGKYELVEVVAPEGYNLLTDPVEVVINGNDADEASLEVTAVVPNNSGTQLPGTGGIGTTIFYILGSLLVVGCGIVLVSRKRMQNNK